MYDRSALKICGNTLIIFALFLKINCLDVPKLRTPEQLKSSKMIDLINNVNQYKKIEHEIIYRFNNEEVSLKASGMKHLHELWTLNIKNIRTSFYEAVFNHFVKKLRNYCNIILEILRKKESRSLAVKVSDPEIESFAFSSNIDFYYLISFLNTDVIDVSGILNVVYFFQLWPSTVKYSTSKNPIDRITYTMRETINQVTLLMGQLPLINPKGNENQIDSLKNLDEDMLTNNLKLVHDDIEHFSILFQVNQIAKPILNKHLFIQSERRTIFDSQKAFIVDMLTYESCTIQFDDSGSFATQTSRYTSWNCDIILTSAEFGRNNYLIKKTTLKGIKSVRKPVVRILSSMKVTLNNKKNINPNDIRLFTLQELYNIILGQSFYLNALQFYNVLADVIIFAAIKEGTKPLKGILSEMNFGCENKRKTTMTIEKIMIMRGTLLMVRLYFEELKNYLIKLYPTILSTKERKTNIRNFQFSVFQLLIYLDYKSKTMTEYLDKYCPKIKDLLKNIKQANAGATTMEFNRYYYFYPSMYLFDIRAFVKSL